ncbi:MAG TPA: hypothetical protein VKU19_04890 [Bryobacteraceae bacterium]|nr:hypothetical protein [Bryobacteraceae bacterium]
MIRIAAVYVVYADMAALPEANAKGLRLAVRPRISQLTAITQGRV